MNKNCIYILIVSNKTSREYCHFWLFGYFSLFWISKWSCNLKNLIVEQTDHFFIHMNRKVSENIFQNAGKGMFGCVTRM